MPILAMGEVAEIRGRKFIKTRATDGCSGCHFLKHGRACPGDSAMSALEEGGSDCVGAVWKLSPKMPSKPKPATAKPSAPKPEPSLYKAIRERLETKDRETLHARTQKAVGAVEVLLDGSRPVEERTIQNPAPAVLWSLDGLVVDPGEEAVGQWGFFWDERGRCDPYFSKLKRVFPKGEERSRYVMVDGCEYESFAYIPNFPGAELLKRTTGYEAA